MKIIQRFLRVNTVEIIKYARTHSIRACLKSDDYCCPAVTPSRKIMIEALRVLF